MQVVYTCKRFSTVSKSFYRSIALRMLFWIICDVRKAWSGTTLCQKIKSIWINSIALNFVVGVIISNDTITNAITTAAGWYLALVNGWCKFFQSMYQLFIASKIHLLESYFILFSDDSLLTSLTSHANTKPDCNSSCINIINLRIIKYHLLHFGKFNMNLTSEKRWVKS